MTRNEAAYDRKNQHLLNALVYGWLLRVIARRLVARIRYVYVSTLLYIIFTVG